MPALCRAAAIATDLACGITGRRYVVRASRFVLLRARRDVRNDPTVNGEGLLQQWVVGLTPRLGRICVVDVGANVGLWSEAMLSAARQAGRLADLDLHAFEPSAFTFALLSATLREKGVTLVRMAMSDQTGWAVLHVVAPGAGTNSLHSPAYADSDMATEKVPVTTLEAYADRTGLDHITLLKVDAEGHDLAVLRGALLLFGKQRISVVQFEYNHRWINARCFLRDAFDLLQPLGYRIGKLTSAGVEFYPRWDADLETFTEGNYVACLPEISHHLPAVTWWKAGLTGEDSP